MLLADYRTRNKITLATLAADCGVTASAIAKWERGSVFPRPEQIAAIHRATKGRVTVDALLVSYRNARRGRRHSVRK